MKQNLNSFYFPQYCYNMPLLMLQLTPLLGQLVTPDDAHYFDGVGYI